MDREDIRDEIRRLLRDTDTAGSRQTYTDTQINTRIDEADLQVASDSLCLFETSTDSTVADQQEYDFPSDILDVKFVRFKSSTRWDDLKFTTEEWLSTNIPTWRDDTGTPEYYYINWADQKIGVYPTPSSSGSTDLTFGYYEKPTALSGDSSYPLSAVASLYPFHMALVHWVVRQCLLDQLSGSNSESKLIAYSKHGNLYDSFIKKLIARSRPTAQEGVQLRGGRTY